MIGLSFVICTTGDRRSLLDEVILPGILEQPLGEFEIVLVGRYDGRHRDRVRVVESPVGGELFFKPFQRGAIAARLPWVVDMDDDMLLAPDWAERVAEAGVERPGAYGFRILHPDGTTFGTYFDAVDNHYRGPMRATSYFSSYLAPAALFRRHPYPTYHSGDRAHAVLLNRAEPDLERIALDGVDVTHLGTSAGHPGMIPKTTVAQVSGSRPLRRFLSQQGVAWIPFADRHLEGRPDVTLDELWVPARAAVGDPELRQREHWLL